MSEPKASLPQTEDTSPEMVPDPQSQQTSERQPEETPELSFQDRLANECKTRGVEPPVYSIKNDKRGEMIAWAAAVKFQNKIVTYENKEYQTEFRYGEQSMTMERGKEEVAEQAWRALTGIKREETPRYKDPVMSVVDMGDLGAWDNPK